MSQKTIIGNVPVGHNVRKNVGRYFICTMIKDEHPYVREWALHHKKLGFDKIVLYDDRFEIYYNYLNHMPPAEDDPDKTIRELSLSGCSDTSPLCPPS